MKVNALVPMKEHSERVPSKNVKKFGGRPLLCRVLDALLRAESVKNIYVDTDSPQIKRLVGRLYKQAIVIDRPRPIRGDNVPMNKIIEHDMSRAEGEHFLQTHSTNPLLTSRTIDNAVKLYFDNLGKEYDSLFGAERYQARFYDERFRPVNHKEGELLRTQDLPPLYKENSCLYIFSRKSFAANGSNRIGKKPYLFEMSKVESVDIDDSDDFCIAEAIWVKTRGGRTASKRIK